MAEAGGRRRARSGLPAQFQPATVVYPGLPAGGRVINVRRREGADRHPSGAGVTGPDDAGTEAPIPIGV